MARKTISVAMTTYNGEKYLREQLDSIYNQTLTPDEIVVCDDCSSDNTIKILDYYRQKYGLKYFVNTTPLGVNNNFYKAISLCKCDYISLSDQDDIWLKNKIEISYKKLCEIDDGLPCAVSCAHHDINSNGELIYTFNSIDDTQGYAATLLGTYYNSQGCSLLFNRNLAEFVLAHKDDKSSFKEIWYDFFIGNSAAMIGHKYNIGAPLFLYRHHSSNVLGQESKGHGIKAWINKHKDVTYSGFISDERIYFLSEMFNCYRKFNLNVSVEKLLTTICKINVSESSTQTLILIMSIKEYSIKKRLGILIKVPIMKLLRLF